LQLFLEGGLAEYSETWPRSGLMRSGIAYQLPPLAPLTDATASGLWPTPRKAEGPNGATIQGGLGLTSTVMLVERGLWPTPQANDVRDRGNLSSGAVLRRQQKGKQLYLSQVVSEKTGALNPTWVEWLMGFPLGWTVCVPSATPSSRKSPS
jgi:hypothetical protein